MKNLIEKMREVIPGGVNSPARACRAVGCDPIVIDCGRGDQIFDVEGKSYIDFCCSWGALIHGHAHPKILEAVHERIERGTSFGMPCPVEEALARKVCDLIPSIDLVRFVSSGTEAVMSAMRVARGYTKRSLIVKFSGNYHGHADPFLVKAGSAVAELPESSSAGVPADSVKNTYCLGYNNIDACSDLFAKRGEEIAAVVIEPIAGNMGVVPADKKFLNLLREETRKSGAVLIFDEVISGFRVGLQGAQGLYGIEPDLTCLGKIIGGGFPAAAFGGRKEIMEVLAPLGPVYQAGTLSGNPVAMEAGLQALKLLEVDGFYEELERKSNLLISPIQKCITKNNLDACIQQLGSMFTLFLGQKKIISFEDAEYLDFKKYAALYKHLLSQGIFIPPSQHEAWFVSAAHTDDHLARAADVIINFL